MNLIGIFRFGRGYVRFEAHGGKPERVLNLAARERIPIWDSHRQNGLFSACVAAGNYRRLHKHARSAGVRLRVVQKKGVPFQQRRVRGRTGLMLGVLIFLAFVFGMSRFVWRIEISGNQRLDDTRILLTLQQLEVSPGTLSSSIDIRDCERKILLLLPELSWAAFNLDGSTLRIEVSESVLPPKMIDADTPCNIVAAEAGQIVAMNVWDGQAVIQIGDTVVPGDLVVSGITLDSRGQSRIRHARAEVWVETLQQLEVNVPLAQVDYAETGESKRRRYLDIAGLEIPFFLPWSIPSPYRVERSEQQAVLFGLELPLRVLREEYILMVEVPYTLTEEEAGEESLRELENLQSVRLDKAEILSRELVGTMEGDSYVLKAEVFCRMDVAREQEIYLEGKAS